MNDTRSNMPSFVFFGTPEIAVYVLEELETRDLMPACIVTNPDRPQGRKMRLTPPPVKVWATEHNVPVLQPTDLNDASFLKEIAKYELFVVAAYGGILSKTLLDMPAYGTLNIHPSLLPKYRGASPIRTAILNDDRVTGVTIMLMDEKLDHGPILSQETVEIDPLKWPMRGRALDELLARKGGELLAEVLPKWVTGEIEPEFQNHELATYSQKITKDMAEVQLTDDPYTTLLKIRAFDGWPGTYFFDERNGKRTRVKIADARLADDGSLEIISVVPEGKREMSYEQYRKIS